MSKLDFHVLLPVIEVLKLNISIVLRVEEQEILVWSDECPAVSYCVYERTNCARVCSLLQFIESFRLVDRYNLNWELSSSSFQLTYVSLMRQKPAVLKF